MPFAFDYRINALDAMDAFYGAGSWSYRTAPHVGSDLGAAMNAAMATARLTYPRLDALVPPTGPWLQTTPFDNTLIAGGHLRGAGGRWGTSITFDSDAAYLTILYTDNAHEGGRFTDLMVSLEEGHPNGGSSIIVWATSAAGSPSGYIFDGIRVSAAAGSSWAYSVAANGCAMTAPQGIRGLAIRDSDFFCARSGGLWAMGIVDGVFDNVGFYVPQSATGADITISGSGTPSTNSIQIYTKGLISNGKINLSNVSSIVGDMKSAGLTVGSSVTHAGIIHDGPVTGAVGSGFVTAI